jgi:two-component system sensor histidine kinase UhpB
MKNYRELQLAGVNQNILLQQSILQKGKNALYKLVFTLATQAYGKPIQENVSDIVRSINKKSGFSTLEAELATYEQNRQREKAAIALEAQERERNAIGMELHDNVNQILVGTKLLLSAVETEGAGDKDLIATCMQNLQQVIDENRKIAHEMIAPDFTEQKLSKQIESAANAMFGPTGIKVHYDYTALNEKVLMPQQKLAIYRIVQEQCTNISKHAAAKNVKIELSTSDDKFKMKIVDDGKGMQPNKKADGIGLQNINNRLIVLRGTSYIKSEPGKGFSLEVELPLAS